MGQSCFTLCPVWVGDARGDGASSEGVNATSTFPRATCVLWDSHCAPGLWKRAVMGMAMLFILLLCYLRTLLVRATAATGGEGLAVSRWFLCAESLALA